MTYEEILKSERCWTRNVRIVHARYMMKTGPEEERPLWKKVLAANFDTEPNERTYEKARTTRQPQFKRSDRRIPAANQRAR